MTTSSGDGAPGFGAPTGGAAVSTSNTLSIVAIVLGVIAILIIPILFGVAGIICAAIAKSRHEKLANVALGVAIGGTVLGFVIGGIVFATS